MNNPYTYLFCIIPLAIALAGPLLTILSVAGRMSAARAKENERARLLAIREDAARLKREANLRSMELHETKLANVNNTVVLQEMKLEIERVKLETARLALEKLQREINPPVMETSNYNSDRAPFTPPA